MTSLVQAYRDYVEAAMDRHADLNNSTLSALAGVCRSKISKWRTDHKVTMTLETLDKIVNAIVTLDEHPERIEFAKAVLQKERAKQKRRRR